MKPFHHLSNCKFITQRSNNIWFPAPPPLFNCQNWWDLTSHDWPSFYNWRRKHAVKFLFFLFCFVHHNFWHFSMGTPSGNTVNCYLKRLTAFWYYPFVQRFINSFSFFPLLLLFSHYIFNFVLAAWSSPSLCPHVHWHIHHPSTYNTSRTSLCNSTNCA